MTVALLRRGPAEGLDCWGRGLRALAARLAGGTLLPADWPDAVAGLCATLPAATVLDGFDLARLQARCRSFGPGEHRIAVCLPEQPADAVLAAELVLVSAGRAVPPHGRNNLATAGLVLSGRGRLRLYDRVADVPGAVLLWPGADRLVGPGSCFGGAEKAGNVRWLVAAGSAPLVLLELSVPIAGGNGFRHPCCRDGRLYLDPTGPVGPDGLIHAGLLDPRLALHFFGAAP
jgi:hypothetical protein